MLPIERENTHTIKSIIKSKSSTTLKQIQISLGKGIKTLKFSNAITGNNN
jgi:hypothetical protein